MLETRSGSRWRNTWKTAIIWARWTKRLIEAGFYFDGDVWMSNEVKPVKGPDIDLRFI